MRENDIDKLFKQQLSSLEVTPPVRVWEGVERSLNASAGRRRVLPLWRWGAVAAVLIAVGLFFLWPDVNPPGSGQFADKSVPALLDSSQIIDDTGSPKRPGQGAIGTGHPAASSVEKTFAKVQSGGADGGSEAPLLAISGQSVMDDVFSPADNAGVGYYKRDNVASQSLQSLTPRSDVSVSESAIATFRLANVPEEKHEPETASLFDFDAIMAARAREANQKKEFRRSFKVGGEYSPTYAYRETSGGASASGSSSFSEDGLMTSSGGVKVSMQMHRRWSVETGVRYATMGQELSASANTDRFYSTTVSKGEDLSVRQVELSNSLGTIRLSDGAPPSSLAPSAPGSDRNGFVELNSASQMASSADIEQLLGYVEVPLTLRYKLLDRAMAISLSGGISSNWLVENGVYMRDEGQKRDIGKTEGVAGLSFSTHAGVALSLPLYGSLSLQVEPRVNYFLSDINKDHPTSFKPYSIGVFTGIFYSFGK